MVTRWLPVAFALHVVCEWGQGHGHGSGTGYFGFLPFLSSADQKPEHPQGYSLATLGGICPSGAVLSLRIVRALNRGQGRKRCANVPLTPSSMIKSFLLASSSLVSVPYAPGATTDQRMVLAPGHGVSDLNIASGSKHPISQATSSSSVSKWVDRHYGSRLRGGLSTWG